MLVGGDAGKPGSPATIDGEAIAEATARRAIAGCA